LEVAGRRIQKVHVEQEERPLVGQAPTAMYTSLLSAIACARVSSGGRRDRFAAPLSARGRGLANGFGEWCRRALSSVAGIASC
jgi:hypothetical protein